MDLAKQKGGRGVPVEWPDLPIPMTTMKHIISFFARKPMVEGHELAIVRLPLSAGAMAGSLPLAVHQLAKAKLKAHKVKKMVA